MMLVCVQNMDIEELKFDIENLFDPEDITDIISDSNTVFKIFRQLSKHHLWSFSEISKLTALASKIEDSEIKKAIEVYNGNLIGYKTCTKIWEKINFDSMSEELENEKGEIHPFTEEKDPSYNNIIIATRKKLVVTILENEGHRLIKVSENSLHYLEEIFEKMKQTFNLTLDAVLKKVAAGSLEITWYIPSISAWKILDKLPQALQFLKKERISSMFLEDVLIYSDSIGVINSKVNINISEIDK